jgi:hypothetical protein
VGGAGGGGKGHRNKSSSDGGHEQHKVETQGFNEMLILKNTSLQISGSTHNTATVHNGIMRCRLFIHVPENIIIFFLHGCFLCDVK